jgi:hypothetical protein
VWPSVFIRHEPEGTFSGTAEEHGARLQQGFGGPTPNLRYDAVFEGNMVAVTGVSQRGAPFTQARRVANGKLVESWFAGYTNPT